jgi:hypothetical protein
MPAIPFRLSRAVCLGALSICLVPAAALDPTEPKATVAATTEPSPADFLDSIAQKTKARWRLLFRPPPPTPPTDRGRTALILGTLLGDSFLVLQAGDAQQFRNNNQDVLTYCRTLGLGEKLLPRLMTQGNLAEQNAWKDLRQEIVDGHQQALKLLRDQMDDDLALLIDIGLGLRLFEIATALIVAAPEADVSLLCVSSPSLLRDLQDDLGHLSTPKREEALMLRVSTLINEVAGLWQDAEKNPLTQAQAAETNDKLKGLMQEMQGR